MAVSATGTTKKLIKIFTQKVFSSSVFRNSSPASFKPLSGKHCDHGRCRQTLLRIQTCFSSEHYNEQLFLYSECNMHVALEWKEHDDFYVACAQYEVVKMKFTTNFSTCGPISAE